MEKFFAALVVILFSFSIIANSQIDKTKYSTKAVNSDKSQKLNADKVTLSKPESYLINLKTLGGYFLAVDYPGSGPVHAQNKLPLSIGQFTLKDLNGEKLESGDRVELRTHSDDLVFADGSGTVSSIHFLTEGIQVFTILKVFGEGKIQMGDAVFLRSSSAKYLSAENGGGTGVNATVLNPQLKEVFIISEGWVENTEVEKEVASRTVLPNGIIRIVYTDGVIEERGYDGHVTIYPNGEEMVTMYYQAQRPAIPPPPSAEQEEWLDIHAEELLGFIKLLVGNDQKAIDDYIKSEGANNIYDKIWWRSYTINQLLK
jgi:hypothetical protein